MADGGYAAVALKLLATRLREEADGGLRRELQKALHDAAEPALPAVRAGLKPHLPDRYAEVLDEDLDLRVAQSLARDANVRITATTRRVGGVQRRRLRRLEAGVLTHPLFGNRRHWYDQTKGVEPGFFAGPIEHERPHIRQEIVDAMHQVAQKLTRKA